MLRPENLRTYGTQLQKTIDFPLKNAGPSIRYRVKKEILGAGIAAMWWLKLPAMPYI